MENKRTILVVDDDENLCASVKRMLEYTGRYKVHVAHNGPEGFDLACEVLPDFIFIDMMMPRMTGHELSMLLQADALTKDIPQAFLTGLLDKEAVVALGGEIDGARYLAKPATLTELIAAIEFLR